MQISRVSLTLTWPCSLYLLRVLLCMTATATSFPLSKHTGGGDTAPTFSGLRIYLQFTWEVGLPPLLWSCPPTATFTSFPAPGCWACAATPAFSSRLVYLQFRERFPLPLSSVLRAPHPLCYVSFLLLLLIIQSGNGMGVLLVSPFNMEWKKTVTQVTPETPAHPCLLRHYSQ
jgi:hypothetical protein